MEAPTIQSLVIGVDEAAALLDVSTDTIRRLIADGEIPALRASRGKTKGRLRIPRVAIDTFIQKRVAIGV